ncbi:aspartate/glutamate racemase family protein [Bacillus siamensis]|uniref:aspartate/glutamate racemase family protein n=1 Tax=Bacillus siamensis TaxID=659243 RepID=UPI00222E2E39|nr:aspartate/glutamate racemase family protein [Bacillus siamensis]UZD74802.1 aspartate/glutamate racemase family protein [Bacillus siamensis]
MNNSEVYKIGILAGMGPRSTGPFLESVLDCCENLYGAKFDNDFPHMIIYSLPTPFHPKKAIDDSEMLKALKVGIDSLNNSNCSIIAIPCNVVHSYYKELCQMTHIPILNIIDETVNELEKEGNEVGLLATRGTVESNLYQEKLKLKGKNVFWNDEYQKRVDELILKTKTLGVCSKVTDEWKTIEDILLTEGINEVVCACTDLFFCTNHTKLKIYDSSQILARRLVERYIKEGLESGKNE